MGTRTWAIDSAHSGASFSAKHLLVATVHGHHVGLGGTIALDKAAPGVSTVLVRIAVASIQTGVGLRDVHRRSSDFFTAEQGPFRAFKPIEAQAGTVEAATGPIAAPALPSRR